MPKARELTGFKFGKLLVIEKTENIGKDTAWKCLCECGNYKNIRTGSLTCGRTTSCGCIVGRNKIHGKASANVNDIDKKLYSAWESMKQRCYNKNSEAYSNYGGRGITVCEEWKDNFSNFYDWAIQYVKTKDVTLDRIEVNGIYEPSNCRWVGRDVQSNNKRNSRYITYNSETLTIAEWESKLGFKKVVLRMELHRGKDFEKILKKRGLI